MKYDRPVWQIMHSCADAMPHIFRYEDVRNWFAENYPDVNEATIRAHLIGLTEGGRAKHVQFAPRSPVFRRVARGEYTPIPLAERGEDPDVPVTSSSRIKMSGNGAHLQQQSGASAHAQKGASKEARSSASAGGSTSSDDDQDDEADPEADSEIPDVILLGSVGERVNVPAPAKEVFRDVSFQLSRLDSELSGSEWFVLSAEHGLVAPNEWISPDSRTLADMEPEYRVTWATWVVVRLQSLVGSLDGMNVRVDAPDTYVGPLFASLQHAGAVVSSGSVSDAVIQGSQSFTWPRRNAPVQVEDDEADGLDDDLDEDDDADHEIASVVPMDPALPIAAHLADPSHAVPARRTVELPQSPGLYGWLVDPIGARELNRCLRLPVRAGLVFVGQVGGSSWHSLADPVSNLRDHVERVQLSGRTRASTFRTTLATVLCTHLQMKSLEDPRLNDWMLEHLSISTWVVDDLHDLRRLEQRVVDELDPPLNVDHLPATEYRARLSQMRSALA